MEMFISRMCLPLPLVAERSPFCQQAAQHPLSFSKPDQMTPEGFKLSQYMMEPYVETFRNILADRRTQFNRDRQRLWHSCANQLSRPNPSKEQEKQVNSSCASLRTFVMGDLLQDGVIVRMEQDALVTSFRERCRQLWPKQEEALCQMLDNQLAAQWSQHLLVKKETVLMCEKSVGGGACHWVEQCFLPYTLALEGKVTQVHLTATYWDLGQRRARRCHSDPGCGNTLGDILTLGL